MKKKAKPEFDRVFARLRAIVAPYAKPLAVKSDSPGRYYLDSRSIGKNKSPSSSAPSPR